MNACKEALVKPRRPIARPSLDHGGPEALGDQGFDGLPSDDYNTVSGHGVISPKSLRMATLGQGETKYLPGRIFRRKPEWIGTQEFSLACPGDVLALMNETYVALQSDCVHSTAMCVRAIIENLMTSTVGDMGSFSKNLAAFENAGYISAKQRPIIEGVLEVGHATIHRHDRPKREQLVMLIDILETLLQLLYVHPEQLKDLRKTTSMRARP